METATVGRITGMEMAPGAWKEDWLPDVDVFPELTELRENLDRVRAHWRACGDRERELEHSLASQNVARENARRDAILAGTDPTKIKDDSAVLGQELAHAQEQSRAATRAYVEYINICAETVGEKRSEWLTQIDSEEANIAAEAAELAAQLRAVLTRKGSHQKLYYWIDRTGEAAGSPELHMLHLPYGTIPRQAADEDEAKAMGEAAMLASYGGSQTQISDADSRALERRQMGPSETAEADFARANAELRGAFAGERGVVSP